ncbi:hypothetical protein [Sulfurimonas sp.]|uniref:hypothetical protein n=1 Tax=Sulfurimonas sp. TaxID=2022749 RepID=UPI0025FF0C39|nr:hypothetical protein [Sulfurimonas sp.]
MLALMKKYLKIYPEGSCGNIHNLNLEEIGQIINNSKYLFLTIGALYKNEKNLYQVADKATYLKDAISIYRDTNTPKKFHAWITVDSGEIIDLAHNMTMYQLHKDKKDFFPILGTPETITKKYGFIYEPYRIEGHITSDMHGKGDKLIIIN